MIHGELKDLIKNSLSELDLDGQKKKKKHDRLEINLLKSDTLCSMWFMDYIVTGFLLVGMSWSEAIYNYFSLLYQMPKGSGD